MSRRMYLEQSAGVTGAAWARAVLPRLAAISQAGLHCEGRKSRIYCAAGR